MTMEPVLPVRAMSLRPNDSTGWMDPEMVSQRQHNSCRPIIQEILAVGNLEPCLMPH